MGKKISNFSYSNCVFLCIDMLLMLWPYFLNMYLSQAEHTWICSSILDAILDAISERNPSERDEKGER